MHCVCRGLFHAPSCPDYITPDPWPNPEVGGRITSEMIDSALNESWWRQASFAELLTGMEREINDRELWIEELAKKWGLVRCAPTD